jgi:sulfide dehydrogenase cytochrome subunit
MRGFRQDERYSTIMGRIAKGYKSKEMRAMAAYFSGQDWQSTDAPVDTALFGAGEAIHDELCTECHENGGIYQDKDIPRIAGQRQEYLLLQMADYQASEGRLPQPDKMRERMQSLSVEEVRALSAFYAQVGDDYRANEPVVDSP